MNAHITKQKKMYPERYRRSAMAPEMMVVEVALKASWKNLKARFLFSRSDSL